MQQNQLVFQTPTRDKGKKSSTNPMSRRDRLFRVQIGIAGGKSNRQLAKELGVDEGTIRRDRLTLLLSTEDLDSQVRSPGRASASQAGAAEGCYCSGKT